MKKQAVRSNRAKVIPISRPASAASRAKELLDRALAAEKTRDAKKLAQSALKLDPNCVDALVLLAKCTPLSGEGYIQRLRAAVKTGERALGKEFIDTNRGHFWAVTETRPYMRARFELAMALGENGDVTGAMNAFEEMLSLNPTDNQGVRDYLLALYLAMEDLNGASRLLARYNDTGAVFAWGEVFFHVLKGARTKARKALLKALDRNPWAPIYFGGRKPKLQDSFEAGSEQEGEYAGMVLAPAWIAHPDVLVWIAKSLAALMGA